MSSLFPVEFDPAHGTPREFGAMALQSGRMLNARFEAQLTGAQNLLTKAIRALASGDADRAEALMQRAARMPYDEREQDAPGVRAASVLVHSVIVDHFEHSEDDTGWLDVVLDVHPGLDPLGQAEVASLVHGFVLQGAVFALTATERRRIQHAFGGAPLEAELGDGPDASVEQRRDIIASLTLAAAALRDAYASNQPAV
ncbi:MAG: hypothetical protein WCA82_06470 [Jiangellales bacterium]